MLVGDLAVLANTYRLPWQLLYIYRSMVGNLIG